MNFSLSPTHIQQYPTQSCTRKVNTISTEVGAEWDPSCRLTEDGGDRGHLGLVHAGRGAVGLHGATGAQPLGHLPGLDDGLTAATAGQLTVSLLTHRGMH